MASTKITLSEVHRPNVRVTTVLDGEIDPYWATLLAETFNGVVEGSTVGLGSAVYRADWSTMMPTLEPATNPRVDANGFVFAYAASAVQTEWQYGARELAEAKAELPKRLAGKAPAEQLPAKTGIVGQLRGTGYDATVMRNWLGWAFGRLGTAAALLLPVRSLDVSLPRSMSEFADGRTYHGYVELALAAWPGVMGVQAPAALVRLMHGQNPTVGDVLESLAAVDAFSATISRRITGAR